MPNRQDIIKSARSWIGVPWRHQGRTRLGVDCLGLVTKVAQEHNISNRDSTAYQRHPDGKELIKTFYEEMDEVLLHDMQDGDVIIFAEKAYPCHVGFASTLNGIRHIIHSHALRRQVLEEPYTHEWPSLARKAFKFRGIM